jgi:hypothetical protein
MKLFSILCAIFVICIAFYGSTSKAFGASTIGQFGGRILTNKSKAPITCTSQYGIIYVVPAKGSELPGPFIITSTSKNVSIGGQILGKYERIPDVETCFIQAGPYKIPIPTYKITKTFNTSQR